MILVFQLLILGLLVRTMIRLHIFLQCKFLLIPISARFEWLICSSSNSPIVSSSSRSCVFLEFASKRAEGCWQSMYSYVDLINSNRKFKSSSSCNQIAFACFDMCHTKRFETKCFVTVCYMMEIVSQANICCSNTWAYKSLTLVHLVHAITGIYLDINWIQPFPRALFNLWTSQACKIWAFSLIVYEYLFCFYYVKLWSAFFDCLSKGWIAFGQTLMTHESKFIRYCLKTCGSKWYFKHFTTCAEVIYKFMKWLYLQDQVVWSL